MDAPARGRGRRGRGRGRRGGRRGERPDSPVQEPQVPDPAAQAPPAAPQDLAALVAALGQAIGTLNERLAQIAPQNQQVPVPQVPVPPAQAPPRQQPDIGALNWSVEAKYLRDFRSYNPRTFDGSLKDPTKAEMWLTSIEIIFRYMKCPEEQKLQCAVFTLTDFAEVWWRSAERMIGAGGNQPTWDQFKERFYTKYFSASMRNQKLAEFLSLEQGEMSVEEYDQEFERLSHFALDLVSTEERRVERFGQGLRDIVRGVVHAVDPKTYVWHYRQR